MSTYTSEKGGQNEPGTSATTTEVSFTGAVLLMLVAAEKQGRNSSVKFVVETRNHCVGYGCRFLTYYLKSCTQLTTQ